MNKTVMGGAGGESLPMDVVQRERAKAYATGETLRYIQLLEQVAYSAIRYYNYAVINEFNRHAVKAEDGLYDALAAVNWMNCDE